MSRPLRDIGDEPQQSPASNIDNRPSQAFPRDPDEFERDPRVSFSRLDGKWILEQDNGDEWQYDEALHRWIPMLDEALLKQQQLAYVREGVDENEPAAPHRKRKQDDDGQGASKKQKAPKEKAEHKNTAVYVTSLPLNVEVDEVNRIFSRYGVISEEIESGKPRIKLYTADDGSFKGDALVVYFRPESVQLAIQMLDDSDFRLGEEGPAGKMRVKEADYSYKKRKEDHQEDSSKPAEDKPAPRKSGLSRDKKMVIKKAEKMNARLADWSDDEDPQTLTQKSSRFDKVVVLKHMFTLAELNEDAGAMLDIKQDIRDECSKLGEVTNVVLFDREEQGIATVRFADAQAARACVSLMDGRAFDGRRVEASIADGSERFRKTSDKAGAGDDGQGQDVDGEDGSSGDEAGNEQERKEGERMAQFGDWLEAEGGEGNGDTPGIGAAKGHSKAKEQSKAG